MNRCTLWKNITYSANINYIIDNIIREYDISKANISVLRDNNVITENQYQYYLTCPRMERQIAVGKLQGSDPEITKILKSGICEAKRIFMESNNIDDSEVLYIRNDAICIIGDRPIKRLQITNRVAFRESAKYSSFFRYNSMDFLYYYDQVVSEEHLDVKGLGDMGVAVHKDYMLDFLCELFYCAQIEGVQNAITLISTVHSNYLNMKLPVEFYRELNQGSKYRLKQGFSMFSSLFIENASEYDKKFLDISYNDSLFRYLNKIFATIYFR